MENVLADALTWFIRRLPLGTAVRIKEALQFQGHLDYPTRTIRMTANTAIELKRLKACKKEPETVRWLQENMGPGAVFYDIGANVGAYSLLACDLAGNDCSVFSFEPSPSTFSDLSRNIILNDFQKSIVPIQIALGRETGLVWIEFSSLAAGAASHHNRDLASPLPASDGSGPAQRLLCARLDDLVTELKLPMPNLIKLDVDGPEADVLAGSRKVLAHDRLRSLLIEIDRPDLQPVIAELLKPFGFVETSRHPHGDQRTAAFNFIFSR